MSVIDLGDLSRVPDEPQERPEHRGFERIRVSRLTRAVIVLLGILMLGASGPAGRPVLRGVWSVPFAPSESVAVDGETVYLHQPGTAGNELTAYDLRTGTVRWSRPTGAGPAWLGVTPQHGVLLLPDGEQAIDIKSPGGGTVTISYTGSLTALDPATGGQLWRQPGQRYWEDTGDTVLMSERDRDGTITWLRQIRVRDGSTAWARRAPEKASTLVVQFDRGKPARVITATTEGRLTVLRYGDGSLVASGSVPWRPLSSDSGAGSNLSAVSGRLVVVDTGLNLRGDQSRTTVYRTGDLTRLWSRDTIGWANVQDCGPLVCLSTAQGSFEAVDPDTGTTRWDSPGSQLAGVVAGGERLLVAGAGDRLRQTLVDAATGRAIGPGGSGGLLTLSEGEGHATLLRQLDPATTVVSRIDTTTGQSTVLGALSGGYQLNCSGVGRWILCAADDRLDVTSVG